MTIVAEQFAFPSPIIFETVLRKFGMSCMSVTLSAIVQLYILGRASFRNTALAHEFIPSALMLSQLIVSPTACPEFIQHC